MFVKQITIEGVEGDVEVMHIDDGALITCGNRILCEYSPRDSEEERYAKAYEVARIICGESLNPRTGKVEPNATNSMIHDVKNEFDRVAGC